MKLLKPNEVIDEKEQRFQQNLKRSAMLDRELTRKTQELQKLETEYEILIQKQRITLEKEKEEYYLQINILKSEVENLVLKRKDELVPLTEKWKELEQADAIIKEKETEINRKGEIFDENLEALEEKLTIVAEKEKNLNETAQKQALEQEGIERQKNQIAYQSKEFNQRITNAISDLKQKEEQLAKKEAENNLRIEVLNSKEEQLKQKEVELNNKDREIADKYATLERTIKRYGIQA